MKYLAYGSNMHPIRLKQRTPSAKFYKIISLKGYKLKFHKIGRDGSGKCNIFFTGDVNDTIYGVIYEIDECDIKYLDEAEGLGQGYIKKFLYIKEIEEEVFFYSAQNEFIDNSLKPYSWYKALVLEGAKYFRLPSNYIEEIKKVVAVEDPNFARVKEAEAILKKL